MDELLALICMGFFLIMGVLLLGWVYQDAEDRGQNGCLVAVLIFCMGFPGIILWLILRNSIGQKPVSRAAYPPPSRRQKKCPYCAEYIQKEATICRYCGQDVAPIPEKQVCPTCDHICEADADFCPNCQTLLTK